MANYFIVMGDILKSREYSGGELMHQLKDLVSSCNKRMTDGILSPYTITLGDEFQGVARSLHWAVRSILNLEQSALQGQLPLTLRYVVHYGRIDAPLNRTVAHGMVGPGLTHARELLTDKRRGKPRFLFELPDKNLAAQLNRLFAVMASLARDWRRKDLRLITEMLVNDNNNEIAVRFGKNRSQIWKRRRNLRVDDYKALRDVILGLTKDRDTK